HAAAHLRHDHARRRRGPTRRADRRPPCRPTHHHALRPRQKEPRPPPELHPRRLHGLRHLTPCERPMRTHLDQRRLSAPRPHQSMEGRSRTACAVISTSVKLQNFHSSLAEREYWYRTWSAANASSSPARNLSIVGPHARRAQPNEPPD